MHHLSLDEIQMVPESDKSVNESFLFSALNLNSNKDQKTKVG